MSSGRDNQGQREKLKYDKAGTHDFVFSDIAPGSRRGCNFVRDYNAWINKD
ncbi:hypothetical protein [Desulfoscipio gibsoniae]|uniref:hypothetical protein n=1 Tax=Desulfoscipio gibsoniae TaxID=102134 RepID=UPI0002F5EED8|nr:hypothetical protein [Desulfoscipio gibsoniae]